MKGVVFSELVDWIEQRYGVEVVDEVLLDAELPHGGAYTTAGTYDWREVDKITGALAARLGCTADAVLRDFGSHLFPAFAQRFADMVGSATHPFDLLAAIGAHIEQEVVKLYVDTELPRFRAVRTPTGLVLDYESSRPFASLAQGMIEGCCRHFGVAADVSMTGEGHRRRFEITVAAEGTCHATP
jgi:hypothetical protein